MKHLRFNTTMATVMYSRKFHYKFKTIIIQIILPKSIQNTTLRFVSILIALRAARVFTIEYFLYKYENSLVPYVYRNDRVFRRIFWLALFRKIFLDNMYDTQEFANSFVHLERNQSFENGWFDKLLSIFVSQMMYNNSDKYGGISFYLQRSSEYNRKQHNAPGRTYNLFSTVSMCQTNNAHAMIHDCLNIQTCTNCAK